MSQSTGTLIIFSGPSGAGKTSVLREVYRRLPGQLNPSISATTRPPRPGETDGVDYHFLSDAEFSARRKAGDFVECFEVFGRGYWYGTLKSEVVPQLTAGKNVVLEIDVDGAMEVLKQFPDAVTIFVEPTSMEDLETRLRNRKTETEEALQRRLQVARHEMEFANQYRHRIVNEDLGQAIADACEILGKLGEMNE